MACVLALLLAPGCDVLVGRPVPDVTLRTLDGAPVRLREQVGPVLVVSFWATWCGPCQAELPELDRLQRELPGKVRVLLVSTEDAGTVRGYLESHAIGVSSLLDPKQAASEAFGIDAIPAAFVVDSKGVIDARYAGYYEGEYDVLKAKVEDLAARP